MSAEYEPRTRSPATVGYLPWLVHRLSAIALVPLLAIHVGVQLFPQHGFVVFYELGVYRPLLDLTLGLVLLHGALGVRATAVEADLPDRARTGVVWIVALLALGLFLYRMIGGG